MSYFEVVSITTVGRIRLTCNEVRHWAEVRAPGFLALAERGRLKLVVLDIESVHSISKTC